MNINVREVVIKKIFTVLISLICFITFHAEIQSQEGNLYPNNDPPINVSTKNLNKATAALAQQVLIVDSPGKKGKEVEDTTLVVNSELPLYAALYNNGKYKSEAKVDWFWAETSHSALNSRDSSIYLGSGSSIIFKPTKSATGFIFVKDLPKASGDSTGTIKIIYSEKLILTPAYSAHSTITQGQHHILVSFRAENVGNFPAILQEANLQFIDTGSQIITNQYQVSRIDTTTIIQAGETRQFEFLVNALSNADTGRVFIDVQLLTGEAFYTNIDPKHQWQVQTPPILNIDLIDALVEEIFPGQEDIFIVMDVSNRGGASVNNLNASLTFWRDGQNVSDEYEAVMSENNPKFIKGNSSAPLSLIVRAKAIATYGTIVINGKISGLDSNTGISYSDEGADLPASWLVTQTSAQVGIISTRINCPNIDASGNGEVHIGQNYFVEVVVRNQGTEDVQGIGVRLNTDGHSRFLADPSQVIPSLFKYQTDIVKYQLEAEAEAIPAVEKFLAQIDSATSASGSKATINAAFDSLAQVKILYPANLILKLNSMFVQIPVRQTLDVIAEVVHSPENAGFDSTGKLSIKLPQNYQLISGNLVQQFRENEKVTWKVRSPAISGDLDTILVYISQIPRDKNDPSLFAQVSIDTASLLVETLNTSIEIADVVIIDPEGARDDTISTGQWFLVRARMKSELIENSFAQIVSPANFDVLDNTIKPVSMDSVTWWLRAPNFISNFTEQIIVQAWGNVEGDTAKVFSRSDSSLSVFTVSRANLKVSAEIIDPPGASQGQISPGLVFQIKGEILNSGAAGVFGNQSLFINVPDRSSFQVIGDTLLPVENQPVKWTIQASEKLDAIPKIIKVRILEVPYDENSDEEAYISNENQVADVPVFTMTPYVQLMVRSMPEVAPKTIAPGDAAIMMGIEFTNVSIQNGFPIQVNALKFDIEDKFGNLIAPQSLIAGFKMRSDESVIGEAVSILQNPIQLPFTNPITLEAHETKQVLIEINFHESLSQQFQLNLKDTSYLEIESQVPIAIVDELRNPKTILNLRSHCPVITENDLKRSFRNYPNPFGTPDRKKTHFIYYLAQDGNIELKIYTLIGELVWSCTYNSSDRQGKKGLHQEDDITWEARNSRGTKVLNGVYIARIKTSYGEAAMTKIAIIK